jgi:hypothetical protein
MLYIIFHGPLIPEYKVVDLIRDFINRYPEDTKEQVEHNAKITDYIMKLVSTYSKETLSDNMFDGLLKELKSRQADVWVVQRLPVLKKSNKEEFLFIHSGWILTTLQFMLKLFMEKLV